MALVEIVSKNIFAGASLRNLEAGEVVDVDESIAEKWKKAGYAKDTDKRKGERIFEVATPDKPVVDDSVLKELQASAEAALKAKDEEIETQKQRADEAEAALKALQEAQDKKGK